MFTDIQPKQVIKIIVICLALSVFNTSFALCFKDSAYTSDCPSTAQSSSESTSKQLANSESATEESVTTTEDTEASEQSKQTDLLNQAAATVPCGTKAKWRRGFCLMGYDKSKLTREQLRTKRIMWTLVGGGAVLTVGAACILSGVCEALGAIGTLGKASADGVTAVFAIEGSGAAVASEAGAAAATETGALVASETGAAATETGAAAATEAGALVATETGASVVGSGAVVASETGASVIGSGTVVATETGAAATETGALVASETGAAELTELERRLVALDPERVVNNARLLRTLCLANTLYCLTTQGLETDVVAGIQGEAEQTALSAARVMPDIASFCLGAYCFYMWSLLTQTSELAGEVTLGVDEVGEEGPLFRWIADSLPTSHIG